MSFLSKLIHTDRSTEQLEQPASVSASNAEPQNDLERIVLEARVGRAPVRDLVEQLFSSQICVLLNKEIPASGVMPAGTSPLFVKNGDGTELVAIFSNSQRAGHIALQFETHKYCLEVSAKWLLGNMGRRFGLALNPGLPVTFEMTPAGLESARREFVA